MDTVIPSVSHNMHSGADDKVNNPALLQTRAALDSFNGCGTVLDSSTQTVPV